MDRLNKVPFIICLILSFNAHAQMNLPSGESCFYWDVNNTPYKDIYEIVDKNISIKYFDKYGVSKDMELKIYDWKREEVARFQLDKSFGLNYYNINLEDFSNGWESDHLYICEIFDEKKRKYEWQMMLPKNKSKNLLQVDIIVNPLKFECESMSGNNVEFFGEIRNGKAPYSLQWYVMNNNKSKFLYQPEEEIIQHNNETSVIRVDHQPDYYVMLVVKDACNNIQQKMVHLICEESKKKINSLFIEPIQLPTLNNVNSK